LEIHLPPAHGDSLHRPFGPGHPARVILFPLPRRRASSHRPSFAPLYSPSVPSPGRPTIEGTNFFCDRHIPFFLHLCSPPFFLALHTESPGQSQDFLPSQKPPFLSEKFPPAPPSVLQVPGVIEAPWWPVFGVLSVLSVPEHFFFCDLEGSFFFQGPVLPNGVPFFFP